jgi:hypothetical protein
MYAAGIGGKNTVKRARLGKSITAQEKFQTDNGTYKLKTEIAVAVSSLG